MLIVIVHVHVNEEHITAFTHATIENASNSLKEEGIYSFDVIQEQSDPTKFVLLEVYKDENAAVAHKETAHYMKWKDAVADTMAEPRYSVKYHEFYPPMENWKKLN
jgi:quinol monooxygenase YgiN